MKFLEANISTILLRFYLMITVIVGAFYLNVPFLAVLGLPIFLSGLLAVKFGSKAKTPKTDTDKSLAGVEHSYAA